MQRDKRNDMRSQPMCQYSDFYHHLSSEMKVEFKCLPIVSLCFHFFNSGFERAGVRVSLVAIL